MRSFALLWLAASAACGDGTGEAGPSGPVSFDLPTVVSRGGPVLAQARIQAIYFPGFPYQSAMDTFLANLAKSRYWVATAGEYGAGPPTVLPSDASAVQVPSAIKIEQIPALFARALTEHEAALGSPRADTIYTLFFAAGTAISGSDFVLCAEGAPSAFHGELPLGGISVAVVVIPACSSFPGHPELAGEHVLTPALSHELVETAADPFPSSAPAFCCTDDQHPMWAIALGGGEIADLCENEVPNLVKPDDLGYPVQRIWSNNAARGSGGPCVPVPAGEVYFNAVARLPDTTALPPGRGDPSIRLPAVSAAAGNPATVTVDFRSAGPPQSWRTIPIEFQSDASLGPNAMGMHAPSVLGRSGQTQSVTVFSAEAPRAGVFPLLLLSHGQTGALHVWVGTIARP